MKNNKFYLFVAIVILLAVLAGVSYFYFLKTTKRELINSNYEKNAFALRKNVQSMIYSKQKATLALALTLAKHDKELAGYILNSKFPADYYKDIISQFKNNTLYKNIWIQVIDKNGISLYRSWTNKHGDNVRKIRPDIEKVIELHKPQMSISTGKYDLTLKAMVPVYTHEEFIGIVEVISHFNSIAKELEKRAVESVVVADAKYKTQLKYPWTKTFIGDNYVSNLNAKKELTEYLRKHGIASYYKDGYRVENGYLIVSYLLKSHGQTVGCYIMFEKLNEISSKNIDEFIFKWLVFGVIIVMSIMGVVNITMYFILRKQKLYYKSIIDTSRNIVIINNTQEILDVNKIFFDYFTDYKDLSAFKKEHRCVCEYFVDEEEYLHQNMQGINWIDYLLKYPNHNNKIKMDIGGNVVYFLASASIISQKPYQVAIILSDITEQEMYKQELEQLTVTDPLTNLKNRRYYEDKIEEEIARACRYKEPLSIIMFDIDRFKQVNDNYGHDVGDKVLVVYSKLIRSMLRENDKLCRIGGEEFVIITPHTTAVDAYKLAEKIRKKVEDHKEVLAITMSFGVTTYEYCEDKDSMFKRADNALYEAKASGRNRVVLG